MKKISKPQKDVIDLLKGGWHLFSNGYIGNESWLQKKVCCDNKGIKKVNRNTMMALDNKGLIKYQRRYMMFYVFRLTGV